MVDYVSVTPLKIRLGLTRAGKLDPALIPGIQNALSDIMKARFPALLSARLEGRTHDGEDCGFDGLLKLVHRAGPEGLTDQPLEDPPLLFADVRASLERCFAGVLESGTVWLGPSAPETAGEALDPAAVAMRADRRFEFGTRERRSGRPSLVLVGAVLFLPLVGLLLF